MQRFVAGDQQASDLEVKERQVKAASKNVVRDPIERATRSSRFILARKD
jgi:hypothetical protein